VQCAQDLVDTGRGPQVEERRVLQRGELGGAARLRLLGGLTRSRRLLRGANAVLVIDGGILDVAVQLTEIARVEHRHRQRGPLSAVLGVHELRHEVVVAVAGGRIGPARRQNLAAVAIEDAQLQATGLGQSRQHRHVAPAIR
jgi:hypothetical protein